MPRSRFERIHWIQELLRQNIFRLPWRAHLGTYGKDGQLLVDGGAIKPQHMRQHDGIGQTMRGVMPAAQMMAMACSLTPMLRR